MTIEIILLALASTVRPTSLAAVYALLSAPQPRRLMVFYVAAGLAFTIAFGLVTIWAFSGIDVGGSGGRPQAIAQIVGGLLALALAVAVLTGRIRGPARRAGPPGGRMADLMARRATVRAAAIAGPATHVPGLFYLVALNIIITGNTGPLRGVGDVLIYNAIWFALPATALAVCIVRPAMARIAVGAVTGWTQRNARTVLMLR